MILKSLSNIFCKVILDNLSYKNDILHKTDTFRSFYEYLSEFSILKKTVFMLFFILYYISFILFGFIITEKFVLRIFPIFFIYSGLSSVIRFIYLTGEK